MTDRVGTRAEHNRELGNMAGRGRGVAVGGQTDAEACCAQFVADCEDAIFMLDGDGKYLMMNPAAADALGGTPSEFIGKSLWDVFPEDVASRHMAEVRRVIETRRGRVRETTSIVQGEQRWYSIRLQPTFRPTGTCSAVQAMARDVTDRKEAEQALRANEERYRAIWGSVKAGILAADMETKRFRYANPAMCRMLGYGEAELEKMGVHDIHPEDALVHVLSEFEAQARGEKTLAVDIPCLRKDGTVFGADISAGKMAIDGTECNVGFFTDSTERKQMEAHLRESQRLESLGTLARGVAHEINNPINGIMNYAQLILDKCAQDDEEHEFAGGIIHETERVADIVRNLLKFARHDRQEHSLA